jgi:hypothetical protein
MFEGGSAGVPVEWCAKVKDGAEVLTRARRLIDLTIARPP